MRHVLITILILLPTLLSAQEFTFRQEFDTIPVEINGWQPFAPWVGGELFSYPELHDIDDDEDLDFFIGNQHGYITYYENVGTNTIANYQFINRSYGSINLSPLPFGGYSAPKFCDLDNDGDDDLFSGDFAGLIHYWENIGTPSISNFMLVTDTLANIDIDGLSKMDFVDLDLDTDFDLLIGDYFGYLWYFENLGNSFVFNFSTTPVQFEDIDVGGYACPEFIDIDNDNDPDLFIGGENGRIWYYQNVGDSLNYNYELITNAYYGIDVGEKASPEFADIDGDGDYDLFVGRDEYPNVFSGMGGVWFYENIGTPDTAQWQLVTMNYLTLDAGDRAILNLVDIDGDSDQDLFMGIAGNSISYYRNTGTASIPEYIWQSNGYQGIMVNNCTPYFCDIDADLDYDLFIGEGVIPNPPYPGLYLYTNIGTPQNASFVQTSSNLVPYSYHASIRPSLADIDTDGDQDLFLSDNGGTFYFIENIGSPSSFLFSVPEEDWQGISTPSGSYASFYDIDDDHDLDLFITLGGSENYNHIGFYRNIGTPNTPIMSFETDTFLEFESGEFKFWGLDVVDIDSDDDGDFFLSVAERGGCLFFRNTTGDTSAVNPPLIQHPLHGIEMTFGPNPANPVGVASFELSVGCRINLGVYDICGRLVKPLASEFLLPGSHQFRWDAEDAASGVYVLRLQAGETIQAKRVVVLR